jgi:hypothetical protein
MNKIFISYRRQDSADLTYAIYDRLASFFGDSTIFLDIDSLSPGQDFPHQLHEALNQCSVILILIGPQWLTVSDEFGHRRIDNSSDFVRLEVSQSLRRQDQNKAILMPILLHDALLPPAAELPEDLRGLANCRPYTLSSLDDGMRPLFHTIGRYLDAHPMISDWDIVASAIILGILVTLLNTLPPSMLQSTFSLFPALDFSALVVGLYMFVALFVRIYQLGCWDWIAWLALAYFAGFLLGIDLESRLNLFAYVHDPTTLAALGGPILVGLLFPIWGRRYSYFHRWKYTYGTKYDLRAFSSPIMTTMYTLRGIRIRLPRRRRIGIITQGADAGSVQWQIKTAIEYQFGTRCLNVQRGVRDIHEIGVLIVLIKDGWISWIQQQEEPARNILEYALVRSVPVIPILISGSVVPTSGELLPSLQKITTLHMMVIRPQLYVFARDIDRVLLAIRMTLDPILFTSRRNLLLLALAPVVLLYSALAMLSYVPLVSYGILHVFLLWYILLTAYFIYRAWSRRQFIFLALLLAFLLAELVVESSVLRYGDFLRLQRTPGYGIPLNDLLLFAVIYVLASRYNDRALLKRRKYSQTGGGHVALEPVSMHGIDDSSPDRRGQSRGQSARHSPAVETAPSARYSMILAVLGFVIIVPWVFSIIQGQRALQQIERSNGTLRGRNLALVGVSISYFFLILLGTVVGLFVIVLMSELSVAMLKLI